MTFDTRKTNRRSRGTLAAALSLTLAFPFAVARFIEPAEAALGGLPGSNERQPTSHQK